MRHIIPILILSTVSIFAAPTPQQAAAIQASIANLQADIAFMQKQERITQYGGYSHGGYAQKIADEQAQIAQLQAQLH